MASIGSRAVAIGDEIGGSILRRSDGPDVVTNVGEVYLNAVRDRAADIALTHTAVSDAKTGAELLDSTGTFDAHSIIVFAGRSHSYRADIAQRIDKFPAFHPISKEDIARIMALRTQPPPEELALDIDRAFVRSIPPTRLEPMSDEALSALEEAIQRNVVDRDATIAHIRAIRGL
jgi:hypothetical protein